MNPPARLDLVVPRAQRNHDQTPVQSKKSKNMIAFISFLTLFVKFFDTFSGIGGFAVPLMEAGHECVGFSEIDRWAVQIYRSHFPSHQPYGDITRIDAA